MKSRTWHMVSNYLFLIGCLCFLAGTLINIWLGHMCFANDSRGHSVARQPGEEG
jgi:hypothetical protein